MNRPRVPVTLPRARFDIDPDGRLAVTVDGQPWPPPSPTDKAAQVGPGVPLGRSDVPWVQQQIADDLGTPVLVEVVEAGQPYTDIVDPSTHNPAEAERSEVPAEPAAGTYTPGEPVVISVVIDRAHADEHGHVHYRLPAALGDRTVLVHGETSGTTLPLDPSHLPGPSTHGVQTPSRQASTSRDEGVRRRVPRTGPDARPAGPARAPAARAMPDDGLGAL